MSLQQRLRPFKKGAGSALGRRFRPKVEALEERATPAALYVDDSFRITTNIGPASLSPGDTVTWDPGRFDQVSGLTFGTNAFSTIRDAVAASSSGDVIQVAQGYYRETGQTVIDTNNTVSVVGAGIGRTFVQAAFNTGENDDARAWFLVRSGATFNLNGLTLSGYGRNIADAIRFLPGASGGEINSVSFYSIAFKPLTAFDGAGVNIKAGDVNVLNCTFNFIGRMGVQYLNAGTTGRYSGNTYFGKGFGRWLDTAVEVGDGAVVIISGNRVSNCRGVTADQFQSAGILVDTAGAPGTAATIFGNRVFNNINGLFVGTSDGDNDSSNVQAWHNDFTGNTYAVFSTNPTVDARYNWWGSTLGPKSSSNPNGRGDFANDRVTVVPFSTRIQAVLPSPTLDDYEFRTSGLLAAGVGPNDGTPQVKVFTRDGAQLFTLTPFPDLNGSLLHFGVNVAIGDVTGDGIPDVVVGIGSGGGGLLRVFDGATQLRVRTYVIPFGGSAGVNVAVGDVNGDGIGDIIAGAASGRPFVRVYDGRTGGMVRLFNAFPNLSTLDGVTVAAGDVNGDGADDILLGGAGAAPQVRVVNGRNVFQQLAYFAPYGSTLTGGVFVAAGDFDGDGRADIVTGPAAGVGTVRAFKANGNQLFEIDAYPGFQGGIRVGAGDFNGDKVPDIVTGPGAGMSPTIKIFDGSNQLEITEFDAFSSSFQNGISVGAV